jgi:clan AA aspartic protease
MWNIWDEDDIKAGKVSPIEVDVLIDTGATQALLPQDIVKRLKLKTSGKTRVKFADGMVGEKDVALGLRIEILGRDAETKVIVTDEGVTPLLGQFVLEDTDLLVDCEHGKLIPNPASPDMPMYEEF